MGIATTPFLVIAAYFGYRTSNRNEFENVRGETITGDAVKLRPTNRDDLDLLAGWFADPSFVVWWGGKPKTRVEVATKYLNEDDERQAFIIETSGEPIGYIQAWSDNPPDGGIDIVLKPDAQGRGLGTDAVRTLARHLRSTGWRRITIDPLQQNYRAIQAFQKAGFVKDRLKDAHLILSFEPK
jgi:aminoglycoside 6'-N-acetyltransferase